MPHPKVFAPREIYRPIGMEADRFRYLVKRGTIKADAQKSETAGSANKFTSIEALKAALINWCDHAGMTLDAGESFVSFAFNKKAFEHLLIHDADYWVLMQGNNALATSPDMQMIPGGYNFPLSRGLYTTDQVFVTKLFDDDVVLFIPKELKGPLIKGCTVSFHNITGLFRFFIEKLGISLERDLQIKKAED
jgi:hypothetical protein